MGEMTQLVKKRRRKQQLPEKQDFTQCGKKKNLLSSLEKYFVKTGYSVI